MKISVTPVITGPKSFKIVTEFLPDEGELNRYASELSTKVVDLEDQAFRAALMKLGWRPPGVELLDENDKTWIRNWLNYNPTVPLHPTALGAVIARGLEIIAKLGGVA